MTIRTLLSVGLLLALGGLGFAAAPATPAVPPASAPTASGVVEQWGIFEASFKATAKGNPFDVKFSAQFTGGGKTLKVDGFYDGDDTYRVRCMPTVQGEWKFVTESDLPDLNGKTGAFTCGKPGEGNHGTVHVARTFHFDYADNSPYFQIGTTCYAWTHEQDPLEEKTLETLKTAPFNKVRMCVFQTRYPSKRQLYAYMGTDPNWDFTRFNPAFFQHYEKRVGDLRDLNIQADIILFHPYEARTDFSGGDRASDERYLRYIVARLGAYRNVWWSMANEYDNPGLRSKSEADWDHDFQVVAGADPYHHLLSIHMQNRMYNYTQPWVTHASIQNGSAVEDFGRAILFRDVYGKPIVFDEVKYEGPPTFGDRWGRLTGQEMTADFWHGWIDGTYVGHGETFRGDQANWISNGGTLEGESWKRLAFLKKVMEEGPPQGIDPIDKWQDVHTGGIAGQYYLIYFGSDAPKEWAFDLPSRGIRAGMAFKVEILDTWNMTVTPVDAVFTTEANANRAQRYRMHAQNDAKVTLPGNPWIALRVTPAR